MSASRSPRPVRRRVFLAVGGTASVVGAGWGTNFLFAYNRRDRSNVGTLGFRNPLKIPDLLDPAPSADGLKTYELKLAPGQTEFLPGKKTDTWGANGTYLAPTLRARDGDKVSFSIRNDLPDATTLHWHGMHLPAVMDGGPHQMIPAGANWRPGGPCTSRPPLSGTTPIRTARRARTSTGVWPE
ncbi:multicopper oxidase domain-containing protein [Streptomyces sp. A3M-1-3]|nr:multicopper oxidase domain-containing protein [Streptomyces sp. A3M-1-3]MCP3819442.1 multicopper oxidase domain-containing protein [Streptomyces sp. A3M-1-3]